MQSVPEVLVAYHQSGKPLALELPVQPWSCELWRLSALLRYNEEYKVSAYAPGYFGFGTSGGGEMFALSPEGKVVCLPFIGMEPAAALEVADSWSAFEAMHRAL